jgi:type II restriction/modification system DNA methylase subunit YeeA
MNKSAIEKFAVRARRRLREQVEQKAFEVGITASEIKAVEIESSDGIVVGGKTFNGNTKKQRERLVREIGERGFDAVMDEAAYTWFNRFVALRFMEVNGYLETGVRVFSSNDPQQKDPDLLLQAFQVDLPLNREKLYEFHDRNDHEGLYKYLLLAQCNVLHAAMPFLFEAIADYTELLFPNSLLGTDSVIRELVSEIPEEDWREVEIIGWLYQYYISEKKDEVFAGLKKNIKISKENIPAATQLFTPHWIVRYMVENSVGRLWLESHPNAELQAKWKYYLKPVAQEPEVQAELDKLVNKNLKPEEIKVLDPACGSGHILVYAFDLLYDIYRSAGYPERDIPRLILEHNLYGLDIDDRAAQLACLAVAMKAREKGRAIFRKPLDFHICAIQETNGLSEEVKQFLLECVDDKEYGKRQVENLFATFHDAKEYGSIIEVNGFDAGFWDGLVANLTEKAKGLYDNTLIGEVRELLLQWVKQAQILSYQYDSVVTNPPYMGDRGMDRDLVQFIKSKYPNSKGDLSTVFMETCLRFCNKNGSMAMINIPSWMFISSYEKLRKSIINNNTIFSMLHLGRGIFGSDFGTTSFVIKKRNFVNYLGKYKKLFFVQGAVDSIEQKEKWFFENVGEYKIKQYNYNCIPGLPIAYWVSERVRQIFKENKLLCNIAYPKIGMRTGDNGRFTRFWHEVEKKKTGCNLNSYIETFNDIKWVPYNKGGEFRKWYGNNCYVVNWANNGEEIKENTRKVYPQLGNNLGWKISNENFYFKQSITWSFISSSKFGVRYSPPGAIFDVAGSSVFIEDDKIMYLTAYLCSTLTFNFLNLLNPTLNFQVGNVAALPVIFPNDQDVKVKIDSLTFECITISKTDWDSFETSWDFQRHPLLSRPATNLKEAFVKWTKFTNNQFNQLKANEEELNRLFIEIYGLQDELTPEVEDKDITIRKANLNRDIRSFVSYGVGCMLGRYSLDAPGLAFAGGKFKPEKYQTYSADRDGILPILAGEYFEDDIVAWFVRFVKVAFGEATLSENLDFIAQTLGMTGNETAVERIRKYFLNDFYKDHLQIYKNRPIYWLFTSGKEKAFNALLYMHRYDKSTIARIRTDYLHELQGKLELERRRLEQVGNGDNTTVDKRNAAKRLGVIGKQQEELRKYDELLRHYADQQIEIDLDDGVRVNYGKFRELLAVVKGE